MMTLSLFGSLFPSLNSIAVELTGFGQLQNRVIAWWVWVILVIVLILIILIFSSPPKEDLRDMEKTRMPESSKENPEVPAMQAAAVVPDDLKKIEGVGPKISQTLQQAGLKTFAQLADATPDAIQAILDETGIRLANPETWPQQARLAADGKWEELSALQDTLKGGRPVD